MEPTTPHLIVGLGNPGRDYKLTRHNAGFMVIDQLCQDHAIRLSRMQSKALVGMGAIAGRKVIFAKPQTFMNLSGTAVGGWVRFYKVELSHLMIVHDDLDLPLGTLRVGIGRPPGSMDPADYVLTRFSVIEWDIMQRVLKEAAAAVSVFIEHGLETAMNRFNGRIEGGD